MIDIALILAAEDLSAVQAESARMCLHGCERITIATHGDSSGAHLLLEDL